MTWAYIAGFFDGEGCISGAMYRQSRAAKPNRYGGSGYFEAVITQTRDVGLATFLEMQQFLAVRGIRSRVCKKRAQTANRRETWGLIVKGRRHVITFLTGIVPFLRIKRIHAEDVLRFTRVYPSLQGRPLERDDVSTPDLVACYQSGLTYTQISEIYEMSRYGVKRRIRQSLDGSSHG